jgi:hypothetical protein
VHAVVKHFLFPSAILILNFSGSQLNSGDDSLEKAAQSVTWRHGQANLMIGARNTELVNYVLLTEIAEIHIAYCLKEKGYDGILLVDVVSFVIDLICDTPSVDFDPRGTLSVQV